MLQLIFALLHLRRTNPSDLEPARRLVCLTAHPHEEAADFAFTALLADRDARVSWVAAQLALEMARSYRPAKMGDGKPDARPAEQAAKVALDRALNGLKQKMFEPFGPLPPAWNKSAPASNDENDVDERGGWTVTDTQFDPQRGEKRLGSFPIERWCVSAKQAARSVFDRALKGLKLKMFGPFGPLPPAWIKSAPASNDEDDADERGGWTVTDAQFDPRQGEKRLVNFPIERWCASHEIKPLVLELIRGLVKWTVLRMNRPGGTGRRRDRTTDLIGWNGALGDVLARAAPFFDLALVEAEFLAPFLQKHDDNELDVIAAFTDGLVMRQVLDASTIPAGTFELLGLCVDYVAADSTFRLGGYRAGEVSGHDMPKLIGAVLMVNVDRASEAARFVNGDWSEIGLIMPTVTRLVTATGWSTFVMSKFLLLCQRTGAAYPLDQFIEQVLAILSKLDNAKGNWVGTSLPARTAAAVQGLADANFPLRADHAEGLLRILDALIDLGDRRSVALEQTEAFKGVRVRSTIG